MKLKSRALGALAGLFVLTAVSSVTLAADRPYQEGPVTMVSSLRTLPGQHDAYLRYLATTYRTNMEAAKKAGIVLDYRAYETTPRSPAGRCSGTCSTPPAAWRPRPPASSMAMAASRC